MTKPSGRGLARGARSALYKHGLSKHPLHVTWCGVRSRCRNPNHAQFKDYGGRGITICARWNDFALFLEDVGERPFPGATLERIDNAKNYEPDNIKWATRTEQNRNRRNQKLTRYDAEKIRSMAAEGLAYGVIAELYGVSLGLIGHIVNGMKWRTGNV